ncbi:hypothetical protein V3C99_009015, partial [Haemonchus contortus]
VHWLVACFSALLCGYAHALFTDQECASYPALVTDADYVNFAEGCAGKEVLGFKETVQQEFHAIRITEPLFNNLFVNARRINFHIYVQNTEFIHLDLPKVEYIRGITIRNNAQLVRFSILRRYQFDRNVFGPTVVTVDGNRVLNQASMEGLRYLCSYCDIFKWSKCSAIEPVSPFNYGQLIQQCRGEKIIKTRPYSHFVLDLSQMRYSQFSALFKEATHVQMSIRMRNVPWTEVVFPKLLRLLPTMEGVHCFDAMYNRNLRRISFPAYHSEGFGSLNFHQSIKIQYNYVLDHEVIQSLQSRCNSCHLRPYKECASIEEHLAKNITEFVQMCSGTKVWKPRGAVVIELDISSLEQETVDELFQSVTYIKMCITMRQSQIQYLRMPNLVEVHTCKKGRPAFTIEGNTKLEVIHVSTTFKWDVSIEPFYVTYNPALKQYPPWEKCKYCVFEPNTRCGVIWPALAYTTLEEILQNCMGKPRIVFNEVVTVTQEQFTQLCSQAVYLQMCFNITNTDYTSISCPMLRAVAPCRPGIPVWTIVGNSQLQNVVINSLVKFTMEEKIMVVRENPLIPNNELVILKEICKDCEVDYESTCRDITELPSFEVFMRSCAGQKVISLPGVELTYTFTEAQINQLFREAVEVVMCLNLQTTTIQNLIFPKLKRWNSCKAGKPAITVIDNPFLVNITFPSCENNLCIESGTISGNPLLPPGITQKFPGWCSNCALTPYVPACGLGDQSYTVQQLMTACAGKPIITQNPGTTIVVSSTEVTETQMNAFCSNAVYIQACIQIVDSAFTSLRCPYLKEIVSCQPGRPALQIVNNPHLTIVEIPTTTVVPVNEKVIIIDRNAQLSPVIIKQLRLICPLCDIQNDYSTCSELDVIGDVELFVKKCAGQPIITFKTGVEQQLILTEEQITRLFENAVEVQMCLAVKMSSIQQLVFPKLMQWRSCAPGKNALAVVNNPQLEVLSFPACTNPRCIENIVVEGNPYLPTEQINVIHGFCINCHLEYYAPACGLGNRTFTPQQLVRACAGKHVIVPAANSPGIIIYSKDVTEVELNRFCSNAVYMQACIVMEGSPFTSLQCPYLEKIVPCQPGRAVFEINGNNALSEVVISKTVIFPEGEKVVTVTGNPLLSPSTITQLKGICPYCDISDVYSKCRWVQTFGSVEEIVEECAGQPIIMGGPEFTLQFNLGETELVKLFSEAVEVQMCLEIRGSLIRNLVFPKLTKWKSCAPNKPAITIVNNPYLEKLQFPTCINNECIEGIVVEGNPLLPSVQLNQTLSWSTNCNLKPYVPACGLGNGPFTVQQFVKACAGQQVIKQPQGFEITIKSTEVTEEEINNFCSQAVYIEACIDISSSPYTSLRCPFLQELQPCKLGQPAITITDNTQLKIVEFPALMKFEQKETVIVVKNNPLIPHSVIASLRILCQFCDIQYYKSKCDGLTSIGSAEEFVNMCAGQPVITVKGSTVIDQQLTETQVNQVFSNAYEVHMCLSVSSSLIQNLTFPNLMRWKSCRKGQPALSVKNNVRLTHLGFPSCTMKGCIDHAVISGNPVLSQQQQSTVGQWCNTCDFGQGQGSMLSGMSEGMSQSMSESMSQSMSGSISQSMSGSMSQTMMESMSQSVSGSMSQSMSISS